MHDWTGSDRMYALATAAASLLIAFLIAGNFGLVPSVLPGLSRGSAPDVRIAPLAASALGEAQPTQDSAAAGQVLGSFISRPEPPRPVAAPPAPAPDGNAPRSSITTPEGAVVAIGSSGSITGLASDDASGVDRVVVTFRPLVGDAVDVQAHLACTGADRRACTWSASPPGIAGSYSISSRAIDAAGNVEQDPRPTRSITVVNAAADEPSGDEGGLVQDTVGLLGGVVRTIGGLLGL